MTVYLRKIQIKNFRTFGSLAIEVAGAPGVVIVSGPNGLGKSSFFNAIEWGLTSSIQNLERHRGKKDTEADYLTREGQDDFSHEVALTFSDGEPIHRRGSASGPVGTSDGDVKRLLVESEWGQEISSLSTYLALTHFLGQGSEQRFVSRESREQWEFLRVPSGVEKLENIWKRLRGRSATIALNRRQEASEEKLRQRKDELARWDESVQRLRRLESRAEVSGHLTKEEIRAAADLLREQVEALTRSTTFEVPVNLPELISGLRSPILNAAEDVRARQARIDSVAALPALYEELCNRKEFLLSSIESATAERDGTQSRVRAQTAELDRLDQSRRQLVARTQRLREREAMLLAAQADIRQRIEAATRQSLLEVEIAEIASQLEVVRAGIEEGDEYFQCLEASRHKVADTKGAFEASELLEQEAVRLGLLRVQLSQAHEARNAAAKREAALPVTDLQIQVNEASDRVREKSVALEGKRAKARAVSSALATIAAHVVHSDTSCPLCRSEFVPGDLKRLADLAAIESDRELPLARAELDEATTQLRILKERRDAGRQAVAELVEANSVVKTLEAKVAELSVELRRQLQLEDIYASGDILTAATNRKKEVAADLELAYKALAPLEDGTSQARQKRVQLEERLVRLEKVLVQRKKEHLSAVSELDAASRRFLVRVGSEGLAPEDVPVKLAEVQANIDEANAAHKSAEDIYAAAAAALAVEKERLEEVSDAVAEKAKAQEGIETRINEILESWRANDLQGVPTHAMLERASEEQLVAKEALRKLDVEHQRLIAAFEASEVAEELQLARKSLGLEQADESIADRRADLEAAVDSAAMEVSRIEDASAAMRILSGRLKNEASVFSQQFLEPLNDLISAFNSALLTSPGTSVFFNTHYHADRPEFSAKIRRRNSSGPDGLDRGVNPKLILSEGQLAANGFSILCSASVSYRWSRWRALLLDDPLQHNDVIHAAAFTDVMRNLVALQKYQVFMSSHDRGETDFIERKFSAAGLPCTVVSLLADAPNGVSYEVRINAAARARMQGEGLLEVG